MICLLLFENISKPISIEKSFDNNFFIIYNFINFKGYDRDRRFTSSFQRGKSAHG